MIEPRIQYVASADGTQIAYTSFGEGSPLVFPANAWGDIGTYTAEDSRSALAEMLNSGFEVVLYDGRGAGSSDRSVSDMSLTARLADLEAVIERLDLDRLGVMGVVHGCSAAVAYAAEHPERVTRMVLYGPYARGAEYFSGTPATRAIRALWDMAADNWEFFTLTLANWMLLFADPIQAGRIAELYRKAMNAGDYLRLMQACEATDVSGLLKQIRAPTLVVRDPGSPFTDVPEGTRQVAATIPGAQAVTVDASDDAAGMATALAFLRGEASPAPRSALRAQAASVVTMLFTISSATLR
jgi:pimeloyl-ACP methyl ester carboxylesterase